MRMVRPKAPLDALGAIIAGGESSRMGENKALLDWDGVPLVVHVANRLKQAVKEVVVITKRPAELKDLGLEVVREGIKEQTPLAGIATALRLGDGRRVFVIGCDMPYVEPELVRLLLRRCSGHEAVVPERDGRLEPLHAVWCPRSLSKVRDALKRGELSPTRVLETLRYQKIPESMWRAWDPSGQSMVSINTKEEYLQASR